MKRRLLWVVIILLIFWGLFFVFVDQAHSQVTVPYRIKADSTYSMQLRGVSGTRTAGISLSGTYSTSLRAFQFYPTVTGRYELWFDASGGTNYSKSSGWSGTYGKMIQAADWETILTLYENATLDSTTIFYDDTTVVNDTLELKQLNVPEGRTIHLKQLSSGNSNGGGLFTVIDSAYAENIETAGAIFAHSTSGKQWARVDLLEKEIVSVKWFGATGDTTDGLNDSTAFRNAQQFARDYNLAVFVPGGEYLIKNFKPNVDVRIYGTRSSRQRSYDGGAKLYPYDDGCTMIDFVNGVNQDVTIENLSLFGTRIDGADTIRAKYGIRSYSGGHFNIRDVTFTDFWRSDTAMAFVNKDYDDVPFYGGFGGANNLLIENCEFSDNLWDIWIKDAEVIKIRDCRFTTNLDDSSYYDVPFTSTMMISNYFEHCRLVSVENTDYSFSAIDSGYQKKAFELRWVRDFQYENGYVELCPDPDARVLTIEPYPDSTAAGFSWVAGSGDSASVWPINGRPTEVRLVNIRQTGGNPTPDQPYVVGFNSRQRGSIICDQASFISTTCPIDIDADSASAYNYVAYYRGWFGQSKGNDEAWYDEAQISNETWTNTLGGTINNPGLPQGYGNYGDNTALRSITKEASISTGGTTSEVNGMTCATKGDSLKFCIVLSDSLRDSTYTNYFDCEFIFRQGQPSSTTAGGYSYKVRIGANSRGINQGDSDHRYFELDTLYQDYGDSERWKPDTTYVWYWDSAMTNNQTDTIKLLVVQDTLLSGTQTVSGELLWGINVKKVVLESDSANVNDEL